MNSLIIGVIIVAKMGLKPRYSRYYLYPVLKDGANKDGANKPTGMRL